MDIARLTTDTLEQLLTEAEGLVGRARATQMRLLAEIDRRQAPLADGCRSLAEWTASRLDLAPETARRLTRTSRAIVDLPRTTDALTAGEISYDRATEIAACATADDEADLLEDLAIHDISGVRRHRARQRRLTAADEHEVFERRGVYLQPNLDESEWNLWGTLGGYDGRIVDTALTDRADQFPPGTGGRAQRRADALVSMSQDSLTGSPGDSGPAGPLVTVFVDAAQASETEGATGAWIDVGPRVGPATLERILCEGHVDVIARTPDGRPLDIGRRSAKIPGRLRRFVLARDGGCCADGCSSRYRLQPHHRVAWSDGGPTDADNLATLCWFHHHVVVHGRGHRIDPDSPPGRLRFLSPDRTRGSP